MPTPPDKTKPIEQWTPGEHAAHWRDGTEPISDEYKRYRADVLRAGGLDDEADEAERGPKPPEEMSPDEHFERIRLSR